MSRYGSVYGNKACTHSFIYCVCVGQSASTACSWIVGKYDERERHQVVFWLASLSRFCVQTPSGAAAACSPPLHGFYSSSGARCCNAVVIKLMTAEFHSAAPVSGSRPFIYVLICHQRDKYKVCSHWHRPREADGATVSSIISELNSIKEVFWHYISSSHKGENMQTSSQAEDLESVLKVIILCAQDNHLALFVCTT